MLCHYMAGSSNFAINYDYSQPAEMCPYNTALNPESTWLISLFHPLTALCAHTRLTTMVKHHTCWQHLESMQFLRDSGRAFQHGITRVVLGALGKVERHQIPEKVSPPKPSMAWSPCQPAISYRYIDHRVPRASVHRKQGQTKGPLISTKALDSHTARLAPWSVVQRKSLEQEACFLVLTLL